MTRAAGRSLLQLDVTESGAIAEAVRRTSAEFGGVDVLVNNAAIYPRRAWTEITEEEWDRVLVGQPEGVLPLRPRMP